MAFNTKIDLSNAKVYQADGQQLALSGDTVIATVGDLRYQTHPTFTGNTQVVDKKYVDDQIIGATGTSVYNLATPSTVEVGGLPATSTLTGFTSNQLLEKILVKYLLPTFSSFSYTGVATPVEVGTVLSGSESFTWAFTNSGNVQASTMCIRDVTSGVTLATNISTTSPSSQNIGTKIFTSCGQVQSWCGSAKNTCTTQFDSSSVSVTGLLPYYWGTCTCPGPAGASRPTPTCAMVIAGNKVLANSSGSVSINFASTADDYLWFAIPSTVVNKVCWFVDAINNGAIGGGVSPACNLFPTPGATVAVTTACWSGCPYCVYVSNKQSASAVSMAIS